MHHCLDVWSTDCRNVLSCESYKDLKLADIKRFVDLNLALYRFPLHSPKVIFPTSMLIPFGRESRPY